MDATVIAASFAGLAALITALTGALTVILAKRSQVVQNIIAEKVVESSAAQEVIVEQVKAVHTLVNHDRGVVLRVGAVSARTLSNQFPKNETYRKLAEEAELALATHEQQQAIVDANTGRDALAGEVLLKKVEAKLAEKAESPKPDDKV